jgi:hypothetical protein
MPKKDALFVDFMDLNAGTSQERNQHLEREEASDERNLYCIL